MRTIKNLLGISSVECRKDSPSENFMQKILSSNILFISYFLWYEKLKEKYKTFVHINFLIFKLVNITTQSKQALSLLIRQRF